MSLSEAEIHAMKTEAQAELDNILKQLKNDAPKVVEGLSALAGSGSGMGLSFGALYFGGTVGLSAAGITSGLATAGALVGGGMVAGVGVLAAPVALLGIGGYALAKKYQQSKLGSALATAIEKLYAVQSRLVDNAEYFQQEIGGLNVLISELCKQLEEVKA